MPPNAQEGSASSSQVDVCDFVRRVNDYYEDNGSVLDFLKVNFIRIGSVGAGGANLGQFRPSRDLELVGATYGGMDLRSMLRGNSEFRKLTLPYLIKPGVPIGLILQENDTIQANHMREALSITLNDRSGASVPPIITDAGNINDTPTTAGASVSQERTLDGLSVPQQITAGRAIYKGGEAKISLGVKGFYVTDDWGDFLRANPDVQAAIAQDCGVCFA
jgi:hypothetical protein